jgi:hypothetical protein
VRTYRDALHNQRAEVGHHQESILDLEPLDDDHLGVYALEHEQEGHDVADADDQVQREVHIPLRVVEVDHIIVGLREVRDDALCVVKG